jgi:hypothetical protein
MRPISVTLPLSTVLIILRNSQDPQLHASLELHFRTNGTLARYELHIRSLELWQLSLGTYHTVAAKSAIRRVATSNKGSQTYEITHCSTSPLTKEHLDEAKRARESLTRTRYLARTGGRQ